MKKIYLLVLLVAVLLTTNTVKADPCTAISSFPWEENFNSGENNDTLTFECWKNERVDGSGTVVKKFYFEAGKGRDNTTGLCFNSYSMSLDAKSFVVLPPMAIDATDKYEFLIEINRNTSSGSTGEGILVCTSLSPVETEADMNHCDTLAFISRNTTNTEQFEKYAVATEPSTGWYRYNFTLPQGDNVYIVIMGISKYGQNTYLDNFKVREINTCAKIQEPVTISEVGLHNASIHFEATSGEYQCLVATTEMSELYINDLAEAEIVEGQKNIVLIQNEQSTTATEEVNAVLQDGDKIQDNTTHYVYVRRKCGEKYSEWTACGNFKTPCDAQPIDKNTSFTENFASSATLECWSLRKQSDYPKINNGVLQMANTSSNTTDTTYAILPAFDKHVKYLTLKFDCKAASASYPDSICVGVMTDVYNTASFVPVKEILSNVASNRNFEIPFTSIVNDGRIAIKRVNKGNNSRGSSIDNIIVTYAPCAKIYDINVSNITRNSAKISGTIENQKVQLLITTSSIDASKMTESRLYTHDDNEAIFYSNENATGQENWSFDVPNLSSNTVYYLYARESCTDGEWSAWSNGTSFRTAASLPYENAFSSLPDEWIQKKADIAGVLAGESVEWSDGNGWYQSSNGVFNMQHLYINMYSAKNNTWLISPLIDMTSSATYAVLSFDVAYTNSSSGGNQPSATDNLQRFLVLISEDGGVTWTKSNTWSWSYGEYATNDNYVADASHFLSMNSIAGAGINGIKIKIDATSYINKSIKVALCIYSPAKDCYLHVKDFAIMEASSLCLGVQSLDITNEATTAHIKINAYPSDSYEYSYGTNSSEMSEYAPSTTDEFDLSALSPNTEYILRVRSKCGTETSDYVENHFTTLCQISVPSVEDFNDPDIRTDKKLPVCWFFSKQNSTPTTGSSLFLRPTNGYGMNLDDWRNITTTNGVNGKYKCYNVGHKDSTSLKLMSTKDYPQYFILPETSEDLNTLTMSFFMKAHAMYKQYISVTNPTIANFQTTNYARSIIIGTTDKSDDTTNFTPIATCELPEITQLSGDSNVSEALWEKFTVKLSSANGKYVVFMSNFDKDNIVWIDDITFETDRECVSPDKIKITELNQTSVKIEDAGLSVLSGSYKVNVYNLTEYNLETRTLSAENGSITLTNLIEGTEYKVEVIKLCGNNEAIGVASIIFRTLCNSDLANSTYNFDDESTLYSHYQDATTSSTTTCYMANCWRVGADDWLYSTSSNSNCVYVDKNTSSSVVAKSGDRSLRIMQNSVRGKVWAVMPKLNYQDVSQNISDMQLSFYIRAVSCNTEAGIANNYTLASSYNHNIKIGLVKHPDSIQNIHEVLNYQTTTHRTTEIDAINYFWEKVTVDNFPSGYGEYVVFYSDNAENQNIVWIDDVVLKVRPQCADPSNITITPAADSAILTWTSNTSSDVKIQLWDNTRTNMLKDTTVQGTRCVINELLPHTVYFVTFQTACEDVTYDIFTYSFTTTYGLTYTEDLSIIRSYPYSLPEQWVIARANADSVLDGKASLITNDNTWIYNGGFWHSNAGLAGTKRFDTGDSLWLISPTIDLTTNPTNSIFFTYDRTITGSTSSLTTPDFPGDETMNSHQFCILISPDEGQTWNLLDKWEGKVSAAQSIRNIIPETIVNDTINISEYRNQKIKFAVYTYSDNRMSGDKYRILFGNFKLVAENVSCENVSDITINNISFTGTKINWTNPQNGNNDVEIVITTSNTNPDFCTEKEIFLRDIVSNTTEYTITKKLAKEQTYYVFLRYFCAQYNIAEWSEVVSFKAPYGIPFMPFKDLVYESNSFMSNWTRTHNLNYQDNTITTQLIKDNSDYSGTWSEKNNEDNLMSSTYVSMICNNPSYRWLLSPVIDLTDVNNDTTVLLQFNLAVTSSNFDTLKWKERMHDTLYLMVKEEASTYWSKVNSIIWTGDNTDVPAGSIDPHKYAYMHIGINTATNYIIDLSTYAGKKIEIALYHVSSGENDFSYSFNFGDMEIDFAKKIQSHQRTQYCQDNLEDLSSTIQVAHTDNYTIKNLINDSSIADVTALKEGNYILLVHENATNTSVQCIDTFPVEIIGSGIEISEAYFVGEHYTNTEYNVDTIITPDETDPTTMLIIVPATATIPCERMIYFTRVLSPETISIDTTISISDTPYVYSYNGSIPGIVYRDVQVGDVKCDTMFINVDRVNGHAILLLHKVTFEAECPRIDIPEAYFVGERYTNTEYNIDTIITRGETDPTMLISIKGPADCDGYIKFSNVLYPETISIDTTVLISDTPYTYTYNGSTSGVHDIVYRNVQVGDVKYDTVFVEIDRVNGHAVRLFHKVTFVANGSAIITPKQEKDIPVRKELRNGKVYLYRNGEVYNIFGAKIREEE